MSFNIPNVFIAGKKAVADEVNENFETVKDEINSHKTKIATLTESVESFDEALNGGLKNELTTLIKNSKALFCANKGNLDSEGNADLLAIDNLVSNQIVFKVSSEDGDFSPLQITNAFGISKILTSVSPISFNDMDDGTYIVYLKTDGSAYPLASSLIKSKKMPEMSAGDVWLDTSGNPIVARTYNGISYSDFEDVPIGEVIVEEGALKSAKTFSYNQNGFDINAETNLSFNNYPLAKSIFHSHTPDYLSGREMALNVEHIAEDDAYLLIQSKLSANQQAVLTINDGAAFNFKTSTSYNEVAVPIRIAKGDKFKGTGSMFLYYIKAIG